MINTDRETLEEAQSFYCNLYSSCIVDETNEYDDLFFTEEKNIKLTEHEQKKCDGLLTEAECFTSLKTDIQQNSRQ